MANCCFFKMKVVGTKQALCEWIGLCDNERAREFNKDDRFNRVDIIYKELNDYNDNLFSLFIEGECAWSVQCSFTEERLSKNCKRLNCICEVFSEENSFQEHFFFDNEGKQLVTDYCVDYESFFWDKKEYPEFSDYEKNDYEEGYFKTLGMSENDFDEYGESSYGGYSSWEFDLLDGKIADCFKEVA